MVCLGIKIIINAFSWNEIKSRAVAFTKDWKDEESEDADKQFLK